MKKIPVLLIIIFAFLLSSGEAPSENGSQYHIRISISQCRLWLYEQEGKASKVLCEYKVGTVKKTIDRYPIGIGFITAIEFNPTWRPTGYSRWYFREKRGIYLPAVVPPGHHLNYMGAVRIRLSHFVSGKGSIYNIHGTRYEDRATVGTRVSGGCIRMLDEDILELAHLISTLVPVEIIN